MAGISYEDRPGTALIQFRSPLNSSYTHATGLIAVHDPKENLVRTELLLKNLPRLLHSESRLIKVSLLINFGFQAQNTYAFRG